MDNQTPSLLNVGYRLPLLREIGYRCPKCGMQANMYSFYGGPAYAHRMHYAIKCEKPTCDNSEISMGDWKDSVGEAIAAWNRRA